MTDATRAEEEARAQLASIVSMVAALQCDYDRLEELRDERDNFEDDDLNGDADRHAAWAAENPSDADELEELEAAAGDCEDEDAARERINEDPLSIEVRTDWHTPGQTADEDPTEFCILLCTGGPAVRIVGELDQGSPSRPRLEYQDWGTGWTELVSLNCDEREALQHYCDAQYLGC